MSAGGRHVGKADHWLLIGNAKSGGIYPRLGGLVALGMNCGTAAHTSALYEYEDGK